MWISRVRVTGGFLEGLDLSLSPGLNVVVGARGSGKTTLLELLRHAIGAQHADPRTSKERERFLSAVLGTGEVVVDIEGEAGGRRLVVDSSGGGQRADLSRSVLILGQNELEDIASDGPSRLNLLDLRVGVTASTPDRFPASSITREVADVRTELADRIEEAKKRARLEADRELLVAQETALLGGNATKLSGHREDLRRQEELVIQTGQRLDRLSEFAEQLSELTTSADAQSESVVRAAAASDSLGLEPISKAYLADAAQLSRQSAERLHQSRGDLQVVISELRERNIEAREAAAPIREALERAEAGLGQITTQLRNVDAALRALDDNDIRILELEIRHIDLLLRRTAALDAAEQSEEQLYVRRDDLARQITADVASNVIVVVEHLADTSRFQNFLQTSLKGSSTRTALIETVSERVLPRQLLDMVETEDAEGLAAVTGIPPDRAQRLIENLNDKEILAALTEVSLSDLVDFRLRDGSAEKSVDSLSTGQKCAVTLPIVLSEQDRILILDQPEDHLDNAFLVRNVVTGLSGRATNDAQTIIATHNPNIPVLGAADKVIVLASDGKVGSVEMDAPVDSDDVVKWITRVMEGGRDAFERRRSFYATHGALR